MPINKKSSYTWIGGLILAVISGLLVEYLKEYPIPGAIRNGICWLIDKSIEFLTIDIKLWWILILIAVAILIRYAINNIEVTSSTTTNCNQNKTPKSKILNYTSENYKGILWTFSWEMYNNEWNLTNLTPCCPRDKTPLCYTECPRCDTDYFGKEGFDSDKVTILIIDNAKRLLQNEQLNS